jgi:hypothetical protein
MQFTVPNTGRCWCLFDLLALSRAGGQTVRAFKRAFDCVIYSHGEHQGDLERYMVSLSKNTSGDPSTTMYTFEKAEFEAHGTVRAYSDSNQVLWIDGTHAALNIGLNNHGIFNPKDSNISNPDWDVRVPDVVGIGNFFGDGDKARWWKPWESSDFKLLGLKEGKPVGDQLWAAFAGRLGDSYPTRLNGAVYFDGSNLSTLDWAYVRFVAFGANLVNQLPASVKYADRPTGPAARDWVKQG